MAIPTRYEGYRIHPVLNNGKWDVSIGRRTLEVDCDNPSDARQAGVDYIKAIIRKANNGQL